MLKPWFYILPIILMACSEESENNNNSISFGDSETLDILTWNIENFPKHAQTINYVSDIINDINVDVIALQEIEDQQEFNLLIDQLNDEWVGYRASTDSGWGELSYLINLNNIDITHYPYTILNEQEYYFAYRPPYVVKIRFNDEEFILINVHFKCCGDGLLEDEYWDEEYRRLQANYYLKEYIDTYFFDKNVIVLGDFNDDIAESDNNIFMNFINDIDNYDFSDMYIAEGPSSDWSFPNWPSHLDHILITNELFENVDQNNVFTFKIEDYMNGWSQYENYISDHRPIAMNIILFDIGDINQDGYINILDITLLINLILQNENSSSGDLNNDGGLNILDVILLVNFILD